MANPKLIIVAGGEHCISATNGKPWVEYLVDYIKPEKVINLSKPNISNDIISRQVIVTVIDALKEYDRQDILVCVMWDKIENLDCYDDKLEKKVLVNIDQYLKTDWFLKMIGVKYFLSHSSIYGRTEGYKMENHPDVINYLKLLDYTFYLDCTSMHSWCGLRRYEIDSKTKNMSTEAHEKFTNKVIISWLKFHGYIE